MSDSSWFYMTYDQAHAAVKEAALNAMADNPGVSEDDAFHDIAQSVMLMCPPDVARELSRRTGIALHPLLLEGGLSDHAGC